MRVLGIETSCDETAAAVVERRTDGSGVILSNVVLSQIEEHSAFGGVVPEIAARAHLSALDGVVEAALSDANLELNDLDGVCATAGPGLIGGLLVGLMTAKALAASNALPFLAINHLEGHALTARLTDHVAFPYLLLLVSGGHTQLLQVNGVGAYQRLATTIDDALGEAFDKTAKMLQLPYPGGPNVEMAAKSGDAKRFRFPRPLAGRESLDMSFSGLKTAVRTAAIANNPLDEQTVSDLCAGFQAAVTDVLADRCERAMRQFSQTQAAVQPTLVIAGGVAANQAIRGTLENLCAVHDWAVIAPPIALCTDNAAMIAWAGAERFALGESDGLDVGARSRWPLDEAHGLATIGHGKRGVKV